MSKHRRFLLTMNPACFEGDRLDEQDQVMLFYWRFVNDVVHSDGIQVLCDFDYAQRLRSGHPTLSYLAICGECEQTLHLHLYLCFGSPVEFDRVCAMFPGAHVEVAYGSPSQNRDYMLKQGKHFEKAHTSIVGTFFEDGNLPVEKQDGGDLWSRALEILLAGGDPGDVIIALPSMLRYAYQLERARVALGKYIDKKLLEGVAML